MSVVCVVLVGLYLTGSVKSDNEGDCWLSYNGQTISSDEWNFGIKVQQILPDNASLHTLVLQLHTGHITTVSNYTSSFLSPVFNSSAGLLDIILDKAIDETKGNVKSPIDIKLYFQCWTDIANIYIHVPVEDINNHKPMFDKPSYNFTLPMPFPAGINIKTFGEIYATDFDFSNNRIDFELDETGNNYFNISSLADGKYFYADLTSKLKITVEQPTVFHIIAIDSGTPPLQSSVQVTICRDSVLSTPSSPIFKEAIYISSVEEINSEMNVPLNIMFEDGFDDNLGLQLKDIQNVAWSKYFTASMNGSSVSVEVVTPLPPDLLNATNAVIILEATRAGADHTGKTALVITGPCSSATVDYPTVAPSTSSPCPTVSLHFEKPQYVVLVSTNQSGLVAEFKVVTNHIEEVEFGISSDDEIVKKIFRIGLNDGLLYADEPLTVTYGFNITATINSTQEFASAKVTVDIVNSSAAITTPQFTKSLSVYYIDEETTGIKIIPEIIYPSTNFSCSFVISSQSPEGDYFSITESTGIVTVVNKIDREAEMFANMTEATVKLNLQIVCSSSKLFSITNYASKGTDSELPNDPHQTILIIHINDINDNTPYFGVGKMIVGYPAKDLARRLQTKSIATVKAYDKDLGTNAEIKYSLIPGSNNQIMIHPRSGAIYPLEGFMFQDFTLTVVAEDNNGIQSCNNATMKVEIKIINVYDLAIIYIEDAVIEDLPDVLSTLENVTRHKLQVIESAVVSDSSLSSSSAPLLRLVVCAFDDLGGLVHEEVLLQALSNTSLVTATVSSASLLSGCETSQSNSALVAAVIILTSVLVIVLFSATVALYLIYTRPKRFNGLSSYTGEFGSKEGINKHMEPADQSTSPMDTSADDAQVTSSSDTLPPVVTPSTPPPSPVDAPLSPNTDQKSPAPRERKRSQPVRGDLIPDPDKLLSYRKHKPKEEEDLPDPTVPGGGAPLPREPRMPGDEPVERKRSTVRFSPVIESIDQ